MSNVMSANRKKEILWILVVAALAAGWGYRELWHANQAQTLESISANLKQQNASLQQDLMDLQLALEATQQDKSETASNEEKPSMGDVIEEANELIVDGFNNAVETVVDTLGETIDQAREMLEKKTTPAEPEQPPSIPI